MFRRDHHRRIAEVLLQLDPRMLGERGCLFGGGTAIALRYGEFRESVDIDFLVSNLEGYRDLRQIIRQASSLKPIFHNQGCTIMEEREPLMDQYGIRTRLNVEGETIKFEIVLEGRVRLDPPSPEDTVCTVSCLTLVDMACSKLLANSDRWNDDGVFSRDLLDLAHLPLKPNQLINALSKAEGAYGESVQKDLIQSLERLLGRAGWLERCRQALKIEEPKAVLWQKLIGLKRQIPV